MLPSDENIDFKETSFFSRYSALPSPAEVRAASGRVHLNERLPTYFPDMGLAVKWGLVITIAEGQCMWAFRHLLPDIVPVPEVYGWRTEDVAEGRLVYIYMELVKGVTLEERWPSLSTEDKLAISFQLRDMLRRMRSIQQDPNDHFLGEFPCLWQPSNSISSS